ncbi:hypothetical protein HAX54_036114 [Datura stramonium]|uniref:Uncharacterized protein n=1 Tax=Datura stramonium TaxID=4076 RepID=A0ABS8VIN4_DATST|nr:hypothetical protein [Datura stramonium]
MKEIKDMLKCIMEKYDEKQLVRKARGNCPQLGGSIEPIGSRFNYTTSNTVDSSQEKREFVEEIEDVDIEEVIAKSIKDIEDTNLADSSVIDVEDVESHEKHNTEAI